MTDEDYRRENDRITAQTKQMLEDFIARYERDQATGKEWRKMVDTDLIDIKAFMSKLTPALAAIGVIVISVLGGVGLWLTHWFERHWNP